MQPGSGGIRTLTLNLIFFPLRWVMASPLNDPRQMAVFLKALSLLSALFGLPAVTMTT